MSFCAFSSLKMCSISSSGDNPIVFPLSIWGHSFKFPYYLFHGILRGRGKFIFHILFSTSKQSDSSGIECFVSLYCSHTAVHHIIPLCSLPGFDDQPKSCLDLSSLAIGRIFVSLLFLKFNFVFFYWKIIDLQCCSGLCCTSM